MRLRGNWSRKVKAQKVNIKKLSVCKDLQNRVLTLLTF